MSIVLSTHDPDHALAYADRAALLCESPGRMDGNPQ
jgi:ABC-type cobalamin/Fe3+-siderophores transport system ATPase subunit